MDNCSIFIGNLAWSTTIEKLKAFAEQAGEVVSAEVMRHEDTGRSKGWGLVTFNAPEVAQQAITTLNGLKLEGRLIHMRLDRTKMQNPDAIYSMFIGNLPWITTDADLMRLFAPFHPTYCNVVMNVYGESRGFAIMKFLTEQNLISAMESMNQFDLHGRRIECRPDRGLVRKEVVFTPTCEVFVGKLDPSIDEVMLGTAFEHIGPIMEARISRRPDGNSKGWGMITFGSPEIAEKAVSTMDGALLGRSPVPIKVKFNRKT